SVAEGAPEGVCAVVDRALAFQRDRRYPDASTMQKDIRAVQRGEPPPYATARLAAGDVPGSNDAPAAGGSKDAAASTSEKTAATAAVPSVGKGSSPAAPAAPPSVGASAPPRFSSEPTMPVPEGGPAQDRPPASVVVHQPPSSRTASTVARGAQAAPP